MTSVPALHREMGVVCRNIGQSGQPPFSMVHCCNSASWHLKIWLRLLRKARRRAAVTACNRRGCLGRYGRLCWRGPGACALGERQVYGRMVGPVANMKCTASLLVRFLVNTSAINCIVFLGRPGLKDTGDWAGFASHVFTA